MIHVKLALPTLGAWSMAGLLGQPLEYVFSDLHTFVHIVLFTVLVYRVCTNS